MIFRDHGVTSLPIGATCIPCGMIRESNRFLLTQKFRQEPLCVRVNWLLQVRMQLPEFGFVDIHDYLVCTASEILWRISRDRKIQTYPDGKKKIRVLKREVRSASCHRARPSDIQRIITRNQIGGAPCRDGRDSKQRPELFEFLLRTCQSYAVPGEQQRPFRVDSISEPGRLTSFFRDLRLPVGSFNSDWVKAAQSATDPQSERPGHRAGYRSKPGPGRP